MRINSHNLMVLDGENDSDNKIGRSKMVINSPKIEVESNLSKWKNNPACNKMRNGVFLFSSPTCAPCTIIKKKLTESKIVFIDIQSDALLNYLFDIHVVPTVIVMQKGEIIFRQNGQINVENYNKLLSLIDNQE